VSACPVKRSAADMTREDIAQHLADSFAGVTLEAARRQVLPPADYTSGGVEFWRSMTVATHMCLWSSRCRSLVVATEARFAQARAAAALAPRRHGGWA